MALYKFCIVLYCIVTCSGKTAGMCDACDVKMAKILIKFLIDQNKINQQFFK